MSMKVLNLDGFAQVKRQLELKGVTHNVLETNVQQFIDNLKAAEDMESGDAKTLERLSGQVQASVDAILQSVPTMSREDLTQLPIEALSAIMKFIRGEMDPDVVAADATAADATNASEGSEAKND